MFHEGFEVPVGVKQDKTAFNASCRNHRVDRFAHRDAERPQSKKILGGLCGDVLATKVDHYERGQQLLGLIEGSVTGESLENLNQNQVAYGEWLGFQQGIEPFALGRRVPSEVVDPYARINQDHLSTLIASRSPSQVSLPRKRRIFAC